MSGRKVPHVGAGLAAILKIAGELRDLPRPEFKARLQAELQAPTAAVSHIPEGLHSITPYLHAPVELLDFLKRAFGGEEIMRVMTPEGRLAHAQMKLSGSIIEVGDPAPQHERTPTAIWLFVDEVDAMYQRAIAAGATSLHEPIDQDYGNREGSVRDPFGNHWYIATRLPDAEPWPEELRSITSYLHPVGTAKLIDYLKNAFDAEEVARHEGDGVIHHAQIKIGDTIVAMGEAHGPYQPMPPALHLYVRDADAVYRRALRAGGKSLYAPYDAPYGERSSGVTDPFGNKWYIATPLKKEAPAPQPQTRPQSMAFMYISNAERASDYYRTAFGGVELMREAEPSGLVSHVQLQIGDLRVMLSDVHSQHLAEQGESRGRSPEEFGGSPVHLYLYVDDVDAAFKRAIAGGGEIVEEVSDKPWGDRMGGVKDPFGHVWNIATPRKR